MLSELRSPDLPFSGAWKASARHAHLRRWCLGLGVLSGFLPYLAVPYGHSSALQLSQVLLVVAGVLGLRESKHRLLLVLFLLAFPLATSLVALSFRMSPTFSLGIGIKTAVNMTLSIATLLGAAAIVELRDLLVVLRALAAAFLINSIAGAIQYLSFAHGGFPFQGFYALNPTFAPWDGEAIQLFLASGPRPFGLFSEPSAMAASIGPWISMTLVLYAIAVSAGMTPSPVLKASLLLGTISASVLVAFSQSGMSVIALLGLFGCLAAVSFDSKNLRGFRIEESRSNRFRKRSRFLVFLAAIIVPIAGSQLLTRAASGTTNTSWTLRFTSIKEGIGLWVDHLGNFLVGIGVGQATRLLAVSSTSLIKFYGFVRVEVIWSILVNYVVVTGIFGLVAWLAIFASIVRSIRKSIFLKSAGFIIFGVWLVAVVATTSYSTLTPIWLLLGVLACWDLLPVESQLFEIGRLPARR